VFEDLAAISALTYITRHAVCRVLKLHSSDSCSKQLCCTGFLQDKAFMHVKAICKCEFGQLKTPSEDIVKDLRAVDTELQKVLPKYIFQYAVLTPIANHVSEVCVNAFSDSLCDGILTKARLVYLRVQMKCHSI
jgi:hypothetical protein